MRNGLAAVALVLLAVSMGVPCALSDEPETELANEPAGDGGGPDGGGDAAPKNCEMKCKCRGPGASGEPASFKFHWCPKAGGEQPREACNAACRADCIESGRWSDGVCEGPNPSCLTAACVDNDSNGCTSGEILVTSKETTNCARDGKICCCDEDNGAVCMENKAPDWECDDIGDRIGACSPRAGCCEVLVFAGTCSGGDCATHNPNEHTDTCTATSLDECMAQVPDHGTSAGEVGGWDDCAGGGDTADGGQEGEECTSTLVFWSNRECEDLPGCRAVNL